MIEIVAVNIAILIGIALFFNGKLCKMCDPLFKKIISFSVIRHSIPIGTEGKPLFFVIVILIYSPIVILSWYI